MCTVHVCRKEVLIYSTRDRRMHGRPDEGRGEETSTPVLRRSRSLYLGFSVLSRLRGQFLPSRQSKRRHNRNEGKESRVIATKFHSDSA